LSSAVIVSRVKSALRSYALLGGPVSRVVARTNRKLMHFELDTMVTAMCAVAAPPYHRFTIVSAGHRFLVHHSIVGEKEPNEPDRYVQSVMA